MRSILVSLCLSCSLSSETLAGGAGQPQLHSAYAKLPLAFELNRGQAAPQVRFLARASDYSISLSQNGIDFGQPVAGPFRIEFVNANSTARVEGLEPLPGKTNYILGRDPLHSLTAIPNFAAVRYHDLYSGIDLVCHGSADRRLEYDFRVAGGADPNAIRLRINGRAIRIDNNGDLVLSVGNGEWRQPKPRVYQEHDGLQTRVEGRYVILASGLVGFAIGPHDSKRTLLIDPALSYVSYLGGSRDDSVSAIALDGAGNIFVTGSTNSADFPVTQGSYHPGYIGGPCPVGEYNGQPINQYCRDVFVSKLNSSGTALMYSTYIGGTLDDDARGIAVDSTDNAYVTGTTTSTDFPVTPNAQQKTNAGGPLQMDAFLVKLDLTGANLLYSTYIGGSGDDNAYALTMAPSGDLYLSGGTESPNFPVLNALQPQIGGGDCSDAFDKLGCSDAFVMRWHTTSMTLTYSTFLGGSGNDSANAIAVDASGNIYLAGSTASPNFPLVNPIQAVLGGGTCQTVAGQVQVGCSDAFVSKISADGKTLLYSTLLGGNSSDRANAIAVDSTGNAHVAGATNSSNFPVVSALQPNPGGGVCHPVYLLGSASCGDAFVAKLNSQGNALIFSTYLGGNSDDAATAIALDASGNVYVAGSTASRAGFPVTSDALHQCNSSSPSTSGGTSFLTELKPEGSLAYSTFFGGSGIDNIAALAFDGSSHRLYIVGLTGSPDLPVTLGAFQPHFGGFNSDGFIAMVDFAATPSSNAPAFDDACVVNAASYLSIVASGFPGGAVAPGEIISLFGSGLGPVSGVGAVLDSQGRIATTLAGVTLTFDGVSAPLLYAQAHQINAIVPFEVSGKQKTQIQLQYKGASSNAATLLVTDSAPGIFAMGASGSGQAAALNQDGSLNSPSNPAAKGSIVSIWATGLGLLDASYLDGEIVTGPLGKLVTQALVYLGTEQPTVQYMGQAPDLVAGAIQVNVIVPSDAPSGPSVPIYIDNGYQGVTIGVK